MAISAGTLVRCYNSPTYIYEVVEADVPRETLLSAMLTVTV